LAEFGGLSVGESGPGERCAKSDVAFQFLGFDADSIRVWSKLLSTELDGIAEVQHGHGELYLDALGRYFSASNTDEGFSFAGASFSEAMERLLLGRRPQPMLLPDQDEAEMYGEVFTADDPRIYRPRWLNQTAFVNWSGRRVGHFFLVTQRGFAFNVTAKRTRGFPFLALFEKRESPEPTP